MPADTPRDPASEPAILAIDNIALDLPLAGAGSRVLAGAIDQLFAVLIIIVGLIAIGFGLAASGFSGVWTVAIMSVFAFLVQWGYFAWFEITTKGKTPGKSALRLRTVGAAGGTPTNAAFLIRNLLRAIDLMIGVPMMLIDSRSRRLGDHLAGTLVVHEERPEEEVSLGRMPPGWSGRQVALVENYLQRAGELEPEQRERVGLRLVALVQRDAPDFLEGETPTQLESDPVGVLRRALLVVGGE